MGMAIRVSLGLQRMPRAVERHLVEPEPARQAEQGKVVERKVDAHGQGMTLHATVKGDYFATR
jgi:hypothetical protein